MLGLDIISANDASRSKSKAVPDLASGVFSTLPSSMSGRFCRRSFRRLLGTPVLLLSSVLSAVNGRVAAQKRLMTEVIEMVFLVSLSGSTSGQTKIYHLASMADIMEEVVYSLV